MKRTWLLFAQAVTVLLAAYFVVATLKPEWLNKRATSLGGVVSIVEAPAGSPVVPTPGSLSIPAKKASPAVVSINTSKAAQRHPRSNDPWFRFFFGDQDDQPQVGLGSGVIVSPDGYILTNNHVVEGADEIEITLNDSRHARGKVIGTDPDTDLAVLKIELDKLPVIVLGNSDELQVGDQVLAIGNPFGVGQTVTSGIVSALGRNQLGINNFENFIQTDAAINPGNSGGALIDVNGNLRASTPRFTRARAAAWASASPFPCRWPSIVLEGIVKEGQVRRGWIGVEPSDLSPELAETFGVKADAGVIITGVLQNGPAAKAGIRPGDVITSVGEKKTDNVQALLTAVAGLKPGNTSRFALQRGSDKMELDVTPGLRPKSPVRQVPNQPE
jgi:serine protease DegQ